MNNFLIFSIIILIVSVVIWILISKQQISLEQEKREKEKLNKQIQNLQIDYESATKALDTINDFIDEQRGQILLLKQDIEQKKEINNELIQNINKIQRQMGQYEAKEKEKIRQQLKEFKASSIQAASEYVDNLESYYTAAEVRSREKIASLKAEQDKAAASLNALKDTQKAAHEAILKQQELQRNQDSYRLLPSQSDLEDIYTLKHIRAGLHKPRILSMLIWQTYYQPIAKEKFPIILQDKTKTGIYKITSLETLNSYVGQSVDIYKRWTDHCKAGLGIDTPPGNKLYKAMQAQGLENFTFELLCECPKEQLNEKEKYFIQLYMSDVYGFNGQKGVNT